MASDPRVRIVIDPLDDGSLSGELGRWSSPVTRVAVVNPTPGTSALRGLAGEVLCALGKRFDALDREGIGDYHGGESWDLACTWLRAERIRHVVVLDAHRLHPGLWPVLVALVAIPSTVWMVVRREADADRLEHLGIARSAVPTMLESLPPPIVVEDTGTAVTATVAGEFRQIVTPACACALTLATLADIDPCRVGMTLRQHIGVTGQTFTDWERRRYRVPTHAQGLVRAQLQVLPRWRRCPTCPLLCAHYRPDVGPLFCSVYGRGPTHLELAAWLQRSLGRPVCRHPTDDVNWTSDAGGYERPALPPLTRSCRHHAANVSG